MDNTWLIRWHERSLLFDPWLIGSEIDGGAWFNEQWHATPPVPVDEIPAFDAVVVTQSYNDHCHLKTLERLSGDRPFFATPKPCRKIGKAMPERACRLIPEFSEKDRVGMPPLHLVTLSPDRRIDPIYYALAVLHRREALLIAPHGFELTEEQLGFLRYFRIRLLATTFSLVKLPGILGGRVNPGLENARRLVSQLQPDYVVNTHDEQKHSRGIVMKIARTDYPDLHDIQFGTETRFLHVPSYDPVMVP